MAERHAVSMFNNLAVALGSIQVKATRADAY